MQYDTRASIWAAGEFHYPDQRSRIISQTQPQPALATKRTGAWTRTVTPEQILKSFGTRAFKREKPDKPELMLQFIAEAHARRAPIPFVQYWGKGLRPTLATPELTCLDFLDSMLSRVVEVYEPGAELTLVFTDTHAALNGHTAASIHSYYQDLVQATRGRRFKTCLLSDLVSAAGLPPDVAPEPQLPPPDLLAELRISAAKWFKGEGSADEGAIRYFQANMLERKVMERAFSRSIFVTFNGSRLRRLFPDGLPIFYMFSLRHGISDKPWFLPPDFTGEKPRPNGQSSAPFRPESEFRGGQAL
jgi:L-tyrosine isonitrile synthase